MSGSVRRIAVQPCQDVGGVAVDLALPAGVEVAVLVPAIVDLVAGRDDESPTAWRLTRLGGPALDDSKTLAENGIHDGELLMLSTEEPPPVTPMADSGCPVTEMEPSWWSRSARATVGLWSVGVGALVVGWAGLFHAAATRSVPAAVLAFGTGAAAVLVRRRRNGEVPVTSLALAAVLLCAVAGLVAVPDGPAAPNVLLGAAAGGAAAAAMLRLTRAGTVPLTAAATFAAVVAVAVVPSSVGPASTLTVGTIAATASIGVLGLAPRLSLMLAGLTPDLADDPDDDPGGDEDRLTRGNAILTGVLAGAAAAATLGATLVALGSRAGGPWLSGAVFVAAVAAALVLRARSHADPLRRDILIGSGIGCATAAVTMVAAAIPAHATAPGVFAVAVGVTVLAAHRGAPVSPLARRGVDLFEYATLAALLPLACWLTGLYGLVRGLSL